MLLIHLSDIHFRAADVGQPDDPNTGLRSDLLEDVRYMRSLIGRPADCILISGDIAYGGQEAEYEFAYRWLEQELCPAAGCAVENVFVIPGNHDVDWRAAQAPAQRGARADLRRRSPTDVEGELRQYLRDKLSAQILFDPIESYNRFAAKFLCALGPYTGTATVVGGPASEPSRPFARRDLTLNDGSVLRLWGFNSVLVSDATDAEGQMLLDPAAAQIPVEAGVTHLVMCHHPFNWLKNRGGFQDRIEHVAKLQLFGHEHTRRVEDNRRFLRIRAGAVQPARDEPDWKPGYNWIDLAVSGADANRQLDVQVWVRQHERTAFIAVPDPERRDPWRMPLSLPPWVAPASSTVAPVEAAPTTAEVEVPVPPSRSDPVTIRSVTLKFFKLKEHEQRRVIVQLELDDESDRNLKDYELAIAAVQRSEQRGRLAELNDKIESVIASNG
jgi:Calcineurin-like phosphoesterase/GTPase-associated adaptor domain